MRAIAQNAGYEGSVVVEHVKGMGKGEGLNCATGEYGNMIGMGVNDPVKVTRTALQSAASVAALILITEATINEIPKEGPDLSALAGAGGGGMGHDVGPAASVLAAFAVKRSRLPRCGAGAHAVRGRAESGAHSARLRLLHAPPNANSEGGRPPVGRPPLCVGGLAAGGRGQVGEVIRLPVCDGAVVRAAPQTAGPRVAICRLRWRRGAGGAAGSRCGL